MTRSPDTTNEDYTPSAGTSNDYQEFNLYLPDSAVFTEPGAGWPVVIWLNNTTFSASSIGATITGLRERFVDNGIAVCDAMTTITDTGDGDITGGGMFWNPGASEWDTEDVPHHDVQWIIQYLRENSGTLTIDPNKVGIYGPTTAAGSLALWIAVEADAADSLNADTMLRESSVPNAAACVDATTHWGSMDTTEANNLFRDDTITSNEAATYGDVTASHLSAASPINRLNRGGNLSVPLFLRSTGALVSSDLALSGVGLPTGAVEATAESDPWFSFVFTKSLRLHVGPGVYHGTRSRLLHDSHTSGADENPSDYDSRLLRFFTQALGVETGAETWDIAYEWAVPISSRRSGVADRGVHLHRRQTQESLPQDGGIVGWRIQHSQAFESDRDRLLAIRTASRGSALPILFTPPDAPGPVRVQFSGDISISQAAHNRYAYTCTLLETL